MQLSLKALATAALCGGLAVPALAADSGFYGIGAVGVSETSRKAQADTSIANLGITAFSSTYDGRDTTYKLQGGYRFNRHVAIEGGYANLGKYTYDAASTAPLVATRHGVGKIDGWNLGVVGSLPLGAQFAVLGKLGVVGYKIDFHCDGTGIACANPNRKDSGTALTYGLGADWNFSGNWFARAEYDVARKVGTRFDFDGSNGTSQADVRTASVGVGYRF